MTTTKTDIRQLVSRDTLAKLTGTSGSQLDSIIRAVNAEVTPPMLLTVTGSDRVVSIGANLISNPNTSYRKSIPPIQGSIPLFDSGTVTVSATGAGTVSSLPGTASLSLSMTANQYQRVGVALDSTGAVALTLGGAGSSLLAALTPPVTAGTYPIGNFVVRTDASNNVSNILATDVYQYSSTLAKPIVALGSEVSGTLPIANGGTGQTTATNAFNALSPLTTKGDLITRDGSNNIRVPVGSDGQIIVADSTQTAGWKWATNSAGLTSPTDAQNYSLACSVASNNLTIALKDAAGSDPTAGSPAKFAFRSATSSSGTFSVVSVTAAQSIVIPSGATLGHKSGFASYFYVYELNNGGTAEPAVSTALFDDGSIVSTTAISGSATSATVMYSTSARSNVPCRLIGRMSSNQTTAGTWAAVPTEISLGQRFKPYVEYAYNTSTGTGADTTSFGNGPTGVVFVNQSSGTTKRIRFLTPWKEGDRVEIQFRESTTGTWMPLGMWCKSNSDLIAPLTYQGGAGYGMALNPVSGTNFTDFDVRFSNYAATGGASYASAGIPWSSFTSDYWRVAKISQ